MHKPNIPEPVTELILYQLKEIFPHAFTKADVINWAEIFRPQYTYLATTDSYQFEGFADRLMRFSNKLVIKRMFSSMAFGEDQIDYLTRFRLVAYGRLDGSLNRKAVYTYQHPQGVKQKYQVEFSLSALYALFVCFTFPHMSTVEEGYPGNTCCWTGLEILKHLSDQNPGVDLLNFDFIFPEPLDAKDLMIQKTMQNVFSFNLNDFFTIDNRLHLPADIEQSLPDVYAQLKDLTFSCVRGRITAGIGCSQTLYDSTLRAVELKLQALKTNETEYDTRQTDELCLALANDLLGEMNIPARVELHEQGYRFVVEQNSNITFFCGFLLEQIKSYLFKLKRAEAIASLALEIDQDTVNGKGATPDPYKNYFYKYYAKCSSFSLIPEIKLIIDNLQRGYFKSRSGHGVNQVLLNVYQELDKTFDPDESIGSYNIYYFNVNLAYSCTSAEIQVLISILDTAHNGMPHIELMREQLAARNRLKAEYAKLSTQELIGKYLKIGPVLVLANRKTEILDFLKKCANNSPRTFGHIIFPPQLLNAVLRNIVLLCIVNPDINSRKNEIYFKYWTNKKDVPIPPIAIGEIFRKYGGKPLYSFAGFYEKMKIITAKQNRVIPDEQKIEVIDNFLMACKASERQDLIKTTVTDQNKQVIQNEFEKFLNQYCRDFHRANWSEDQSWGNYPFYRDALKLFKSLLVVGKSIDQTVSKKIETKQSKKLRYASRMNLHSRCVQIINIRLRSQVSGIDELAIIRDLIIERCGEIAAIFVNDNIKDNIHAALMVGAILKNFYSQYKPLDPQYKLIYVKLNDETLEFCSEDALKERMIAVSGVDNEELYRGLASAKLPDAQMPPPVGKQTPAAQAAVRSAVQKQGLPGQSVVARATNMPVPSESASGFFVKVCIDASGRESIAPSTIKPAAAALLTPAANNVPQAVNPIALQFPTISTFAAGNQAGNQGQPNGARPDVLEGETHKKARKE